METVLAGESGTSLTLVGVVKEEEGEYECVASNEAGNDRTSVILVVNSESHMSHCLSLSFSLPPSSLSLWIYTASLLTQFRC